MTDKIEGGEVMDATQRGDCIAEVMRKHYDEHRPSMFWEWITGKRRSTDPGFADSLMIGLANVCLAEDRKLPPAHNGAMDRRPMTDAQRMEIATIEARIKIQNERTAKTLFVSKPTASDELTQAREEIARLREALMVAATWLDGHDSTAGQAIRAQAGEAS